MWEKSTKIKCQQRGKNGRANNDYVLKTKANRD